MELIDSSGNIFGDNSVQILGPDGKPKTTGGGGGSPTGPAGGDLNGTYPNPGVNWSSGSPVYDLLYYPLSLNPSGYLTGITGTQVTTALGYTPVPETRNLTINGTTYDLSADRSWTISTASNLEIKDEGVTLTAAATSIDFTGSGVTASAVGSAVTVNVNGGVAAASNLFNYYNFI